MSKQIVIPRQILDIKDPQKRKRAIYELAKKAQIDLTQSHRKIQDLSKRSVVVEQDE